MSQIAKQAAQYFPIIVCGGGIGGLTFGLSCTKYGFKPLIIDQAKEFDSKVGQGIGLWGPAQMALKQLGLEKKLQEDGKVMFCAGYRSKQLDDWLVRPSNRIDRLTSCLCLRRGTLQKTLRESFPSDQLLLGKRVEQIQQLENLVRITLDDGTILETSLLVGADGLHSKVRQSIFPDIQPRYAGYSYYQGVSNNSELSNFPAFEAWGSYRRFGIVGLKDPQCYWFAVGEHNIQFYSQTDGLIEDEPTSSKTQVLSELEKEELLYYFKDFGKLANQVINSTKSQEIVKTPIYELPKMKEWSQGRIVLLGDACHAMAPNLAQGACLAIEDALQLSSSIYQALLKESRNRDLQYSFEQCMKETDFVKNSIISNYVQKRRLRAHIVQTLVPMVHQVGRLDGKAEQFRNAFFKAWSGKFKTYIFDKTHQFCLGWSYTAPNLGQGLYTRIIGQNLFNYPKGLVDFHINKAKQLDGKQISVDFSKRGCVAEGNCNIYSDNNYFVNAVEKLFQLPQNMNNGKVILTVSCNEDGSELWQRQFINSCGQVNKFDSLQYVKGEKLYEEIFNLVIVMNLEEKGDNRTFYHNTEGFYFKIPFTNLKIKIPQFLAPKVKAETIGTDNGWKYNVELSYLNGKYNILTYKGEITKVQNYF
ncbi:hypothetical protein ABPG74_000793 [Tetrahymena malaccensis]